MRVGEREQALHAHLAAEPALSEAPERRAGVEERRWGLVATCIVSPS